MSSAGSYSSFVSADSSSGGNGSPRAGGPAASASSSAFASASSGRASSSRSVGAASSSRSLGVAGSSEQQAQVQQQENKKEKEKKKKKARVFSSRCWLARNYPVSLAHLIPLLEVVAAGNKHFAQVGTGGHVVGDLGQGSGGHQAQQR